MTINADSIEEYLNTEDIVYISSLPTPEEKESAIFSRITTLPTVQVKINPGQTETPIKNSIPTYRNLSTDTINNCDLGEKIQIAISEQGGCFNTEDLPEIATIEELLNHLCEVLIRFDTDPNNYLKDDYTVLLKTICNSLIHLYLHENEIDYNKALNKPRINDIELVGNKTSHDLNLADANHNHDNLYGTKQEILDLQTNKQDKLTAGENIVISDNVISADLSAYLTTDEALNTYETIENVQILSNTVSGHTGDISDLEENKADKSITLSGYGITDAYTKTEIDNKISAVFKYKGSVPTHDDLIALTGMTVGDVYNVTETGDNYAWTGTLWDKLSGEIDLSAYLTIADASNTYETIINVNLLSNIVSGNTEDISDLQTDKADKATTLSGYEITDAYTKTEIDNKLNNTRTYKILNTPVSTWSASTTYTKYPYEAVILIDNIKELDSVEVIYNIIDAESTNYATGGELYDGYIKIFAKVNTEITIPTLVITKIDL